MLEPSCEKERLQWLWVDQGYSGAGFAHAIAEISGAQVELIKRTQAGFQVLPRRADSVRLDYQAVEGAGRKSRLGPFWFLEGKGREMGYCWFPLLERGEKVSFVSGLPWCHWFPAICSARRGLGLRLDGCIAEQRDEKYKK